MSAGKPLPNGVIAGQPVNDQGNYYAADGTFMNADGTRSIFDDVDDDGEACSSCYSRDCNGECSGDGQMGD